MENPYTRRAVLGLAGISSITGCITPLLPDWSEDRPRLGTVVFGNSRHKSTVVDFRIERNSEKVYHENLELYSGTTELIEPTWSSEPAEYIFYWVTDIDLKLQKYEYSRSDPSVRDADCVHFILELLPEDHPLGSDFNVNSYPVEDVEFASCNL